jgi:hypothetical protein
MRFPWTIDNECTVELVVTDSKSGESGRYSRQCKPAATSLVCVQVGKSVKVVHCVAHIPKTCDQRVR